MKISKILLASALLLSHNSSLNAAPTDSTFKSVGLVLSGGGAKGIAHIGVIQALEDNDIPIDYIAGTSMGAIVGGLYAMGYTPAEMMQMLESKGFANWSTGKIDEKLTYYFYKTEQTPALLNVSIATRDSTGTSSILPSSLISPLPMNFAFMELFSAYTAQCNGDFDKLFVPFRCVASDVYRKRKIVCRSGSLGDAVRASMSFPVVFHPIEMDSVLVYDGGIYDNFPVDVMKHDFAPSIMIGVDVSAPDGKPKANDLIDQLEDMIIQNNDYSLPDEDGIKLRINLEQFSLLDFPKARQIYMIGYNHAMEMMDSIKNRIPTRVPVEERRLRRAVFKSSTPYITFDSVNVTGGTPKQNKYFKNIFVSAHDDTFGISHARDAYYRAITGGKLRNLIPQATQNPETGLFTLNLKASVKDNLNVGFGGFITSSTNSMVFLSGGYNSLTMNHFESQINAWIGQSYMAAQATARIFMGSKRPTSLSLDGVISRMNYNSSDRFFYEENPTYVSTLEAFGRAKYSIATGRNSKMDIGAGFGHLNYRFYPTLTTITAKSKRSNAFYNLGQLMVQFKRNTLDNNSYPSSGSYLKATAEGFAGTYHYNSVSEIHQSTRSTRPWARAEVNYNGYISIGNNLALGIETNLVASTRNLPSTYDQAIVIAEEFTPTPSSFNSFNPEMRAFSYITAGIIPIWKINDNLQLRTTAHGFLPMRRIKSDMIGKPYYGKWFSDPTFFAEIAGVYNFPFASLSVYGNYSDAPARKWSCGISFGLYFLAPKFF